jgi:hypothetical protein
MPLSSMLRAAGSTIVDIQVGLLQLAVCFDVVTLAISALEMPAKGLASVRRVRYPVVDGCILLLSGFSLKVARLAECLMALGTPCRAWWWQRICCWALEAVVRGLKTVALKVFCAGRVAV